MPKRSGESSHRESPPTGAEPSQPAVSLPESTTRQLLDMAAEAEASIAARHAKVGLPTDASVFDYTRRLFELNQQGKWP